MDRLTLRNILVEEVIEFSGIGASVITIPIIDDDERLYGLALIEEVKHWGADFVMLASIEGNKIIIERDSMDTQLTQGLLYNGVPREQLILAYNDEPVETWETEAWMPQS